MKEDTTLEISLSKTKIIKLLFFCVVFLGAGLWMTMGDPQVDNPVFNSRIVKALVSVGGMVMGVVGMYVFTKKLLDKKPGLVLSKEGVYDNSSAISLGFIPWEDIASVSETAVKAALFSKQHFVTVKLANADKYIEREESALKRKLLKMNNHHSAIQISANALDIKHDALNGLIQEYFAKFK